MRRKIAGIPLRFPSDSQCFLDGTHELGYSLIHDPTGKPTVHMDKACAPPALIIDIGGGSFEASRVCHIGGDGDESLIIGTFPLINIGIQTLKVGSVFVCDEVPVNASPSYPRWNGRDGPVFCQSLINIPYNNAR